MLEKNQEFCPMQVAFTLNSTERRPNLGAPTNILMGQATWGLEPNSHNRVLDIGVDIEARKMKALEEGL